MNVVVTGVVFFESDIQWTFDYAEHFEPMIEAAKENDISLALKAKEVNTSWRHDEGYQAVVSFAMVFDNDKKRVSLDPLRLKAFVRDVMDYFMTDADMTPFYIEDVVVDVNLPNTGEVSRNELSETYLISKSEFGDDYDNVETIVAWEQFKRSNEYMNFLMSDIKDWRNELAKLRRNNALPEGVDAPPERQFVEKINTKRRLFVFENEDKEEDKTEEKVVEKTTAKRKVFVVG
jgi:hypothetical protein